SRDVRLESELYSDGNYILGAELELPHRIGARLEQQLGRRVEQHACQDESPARRVHGFLTITRRESLATIRTPTGCAFRKSARSFTLNMAYASRQDDLHPGEAPECESQCGGGAPAAQRCGSDSRCGQHGAPGSEPGEIARIQFGREIRLQESQGFREMGRGPERRGSEGDPEQ